jgi:hypothetical protein
MEGGRCAAWLREISYWLILRPLGYALRFIKERLCGRRKVRLTDRTPCLANGRGVIWRNPVYLSQVGENLLFGDIIAT